MRITGTSSLHLPFLKEITTFILYSSPMRMSQKKNLLSKWIWIGAIVVVVMVLIVASLKPDAEAAELTRQVDFTKWTVHIDAYTLIHDDIVTIFKS